jgi:outer membrane protein TolC
MDQRWHEAMVDLAAQPADMCFHDHRLRHEMEPPYIFKQHGAGDNLALVQQQIFEQFEFLGFQIDLSAGALHRAAQPIEFQIRDFKFGAFGRRRTAAVQGDEPGGEFLESKRFYQIIIAAGPQALQPVIQPAHSGEEQGRGVDACPAQGAQQRKPVEQWQHAVDDQHVEPTGGSTQQPVAPVWGHGYLMAFGLQPGAEICRGLGVVLDQQDAHWFWLAHLRRETKGIGERLNFDKAGVALRSRSGVQRMHMSLPMLRRAPWLGCWVLAACTAYHPAPLVTIPPLHSQLNTLNLTRPDGGAISIAVPLSLPDLAALAVLNDPDLIAARAQHDVADAELLSAGLPPDPSISGGFGALLGGPGSMPSIAAGLTQDVGALITYKASRQAAKAGLAQVDAGILWQEWQVASQAEQLAVSLEADQAIIASLRQEVALLGPIDTATQAQIAQFNQTMVDGATSLAALGTAQSALDAAVQTEAHDHDQLDALLGLLPGTAVPLAPAAVLPPAPGMLAPAIATLAERRPDLIALRYGYTQADARLRAAILTQFLPISLGAAGGRDTSGVNTVGPQVTLTLPLFNHGRGAIASASATRAALAAQYQASLDSAVGGAQALYASVLLLQMQAATAGVQAEEAASTARFARQAFTTGQISAPAFATLQSAADERQRAAITLRAQLQTAEISLATMLGLGLPPLKDSAP